MTSGMVSRQANASGDFDPDNVDRMRLKVNRVNLVQTIDADDSLLSQLRQLNLIDSNEFITMLAKNTREEKIRYLIDQLSTKKHVRKDWYVAFRRVLVEKNYGDLITFLDNTIIKKPKFVTKFRSNTRLMYKNNNEASNGFYSENTGSLAVFTNSDDNFNNSNRNNIIALIENFNESNFDQLMKKFPTYSKKPTGLYTELDVSKDPEDHKQLDLEYEAFDLMQKLELIYSLHKSNASNNKNRHLFILDTQTFKHILNNKHAHMYMKYFKNLIDLVKVDLLKYLKDCFVERLKEGKVIKLKHFVKLDDLLFKFTQFLIHNERFEYANELLGEFLNYLEVVDESNPADSSESNLSRFNALSYLILVKNNLFDFKSSLDLYDRAGRIYKASSAILFFNNQESSLNPTALFYSIGYFYYEIGKFEEALEFFNKALKSVSYDSDILIDLLGAASSCYMSKWMVKEAESLAILALKAARHIYGTNSHHFVKALLFYCNFSNEFFQDKTTVETCEFTLKMAKKVYGFDSIAVADAYKACSKAYTLNKAFSSPHFFDFAQKANKIATEFYPTNSPKLISYEICFISALQWKSINAQEIEVKTVCLNDAYNLCIQTTKVCINIYGQENYTTAKIYRMLGSLLYYMERDTESEEIHKFSLELMESIFSQDSLHYLLAKSTLGVFYKLIGRPNEAIEIFLDVIGKIKLDEIRHLLGFTKWLPSVYSNLSECYRLKKADESAIFHRKQADNLRIIASNNMAHRRDVLREEIFNPPPQALNEYLTELIKASDSNN